MGISVEARAFGATVETASEDIGCDFGIAPQCHPTLVASREWVGMGRVRICLHCLVAAVEEMVKQGKLAYLHEESHPHCDPLLGLEVQE